MQRSGLLEEIKNIKIMKIGEEIVLILFAQCLKAGDIPFDHSGSDVLKQWYWYSDNSRTPTWTAAEPFYKYLTSNNNDNTSNYGIYARLANYNEIRD